MGKRWLISAIVLVCVSAGMFTGCTSGGAEEISPSETQIDNVAVQQYASEVIAELDTLYGKFEDDEVYAERISNEKEAPYQMAIGHMAEVRAVADRIETKLAPSGVEEIRSTTITKLDRKSVV